MTSIDISPDGMAFVSGGADREVKLWNYDEGHCYFVGRGHSEPVVKVNLLSSSMSGYCSIIVVNEFKYHYPF